MTEQELIGLIEDTLITVEQWCKFTFDREACELITEEVYNDHRELIDES